MNKYFPKSRKDLRALYSDLNKAKVLSCVEIILATVVSNAKQGMLNLTDFTIIPVHQTVTEYLQHCNDIVDMVRINLPDSTITLHENGGNLQVDIDWS